MLPLDDLNHGRNELLITERVGVTFDLRSFHFMGAGFSVFVREGFLCLLVDGRLDEAAKVGAKALKELFDVLGYEP